MLENKHWQRYVVTVLLCLLWFCCYVPAAWADDAAGGFVWKVQKNQQAPSYLIGTIHLGKAGSQLPQSYQQVLQQSRLLVVESQESDWLGEAAHMRQRQLQALMYDPKTLQAQWGSQRIDALNRILSQKNSALRLQKNAQMAPWMAWMLVATDYTMPGYTLEAGIDALLIKQAQQQHQAVVSLEAMEPIKAFAAIPKPILMRAVDAHIEHHLAADQEQKVLLELYAQQNSRRLVQMVLDEAAAVRFFPKQDQRFWQQWLYGDLLQQRNAAWLPKIERHVKQQPTTIAVGAAHLFGGSGLIALLRERGFTVTPLAKQP